jgi:hypothetical protein
MLLLDLESGERARDQNHNNATRSWIVLFWKCADRPQSWMTRGAGITNNDSTRLGFGSTNFFGLSQTGAPRRRIPCK